MQFSYYCRGFTTDPGADIMSPGLVSDGTKCSDGHVSIQKFHNIEVIC